MALPGRLPGLSTFDERRAREPYLQISPDMAQRAAIRGALADLLRDPTFVDELLAVVRERTAHQQDQERRREAAEYAAERAANLARIREISRRGTLTFVARFHQLDLIHPRGFRMLSHEACGEPFDICPCPAEPLAERACRCGAPMVDGQCTQRLADELGIRSVIPDA